jgi:phage FluMu protein Com
MPKYKCKNIECKAFNKEIIIEKSVSKFIKGEFVDSGSICPECKQIMEVVKPSQGFTTFIHGGPNICKK